MTPSFDPTMPPPEVIERWRKERITNFSPDELRVVGTLHQTTAKTARGHRRLVTQEELDAAADAWDETERRLFDSHGMVMDLRKRLDAAEKLCKDVRSSAVEFDDPRIGYVTVQIDRWTWYELAALAGRKP